MHIKLINSEIFAIFPKYFVYFNFFVFSMLLLVMSANFLVMFFGWELVGLSSYLLISFWSEKKKAAKAGNKAFVLNRIGDFGFLIALMMILNTYDTFSFKTVFATTLINQPQNLDLIVVFLMIGAFGKSAQFPLHIWLPDAMEGPTPVSALIHAATMVAAGVYLAFRLFPIFTPQALTIIAYIGGVTAVFAAIIAITQNDIKKVLAYSTVSQLGYMVLAVGVGAYTYGFFHLVTHAAFKAGLFLCSGSAVSYTHLTLPTNREV